MQTKVRTLRCYSLSYTTQEIKDVSAKLSF